MECSWVFHNSYDAYFRAPFGAVPCRTKITLRLEIEDPLFSGSAAVRVRRQGAGTEHINMDLYQDREERKVFQAEIAAPEDPGWLWYYFVIEKEGMVFYYGNNGEKLGGQGELWMGSYPPEYQITVYREGPPPPQWFREGIIYQIFADRFFAGSGGQALHMKKGCFIHDRWEDTPVYFQHPYTGAYIFDFFGGNLEGVKEKLPYLKEMGVSIIYFNPIFQSPSNHKYDTGDYHQIDPMLGTNEIFQDLCQRAREMGIQIILDGVFSHTGSDSIYFNKEGNYPDLGAYQSQESPYYPWYRFEEFPRKYDCWWGIETLPNVNEMEPSYREFIIDGPDSVLRYWIKQGAKGWRLDVADELPDEFIAGFRKVMKETDPAAVLIGEVWEDASNKVSYGNWRQYLLGDELDSVMNYPFRNILIHFVLGLKDGWKTHQALMSLSENYPRYHFYTTMNLLGSHDVARILTVLGEAPLESSLPKPEQAMFRLAPEQKELAVRRLKLLCLWQMTFPGVPAVYYGDEAGMEGYDDPLNRGTYPWGKENMELVDWYQRVICLRNRYQVLRTGAWFPVYAQGDVYGYVRKITNHRDLFHEQAKNGTALILLNRNPREKVSVPVHVGRWCPQEMKDLLAEKEVGFHGEWEEICLGPLEGKLYVKEEDHETEQG
ncbi:glycoside hydrolase family 13 protein [Candidatus Formimonas warabiya]|uniref:Alpha-glycosidase n=1 Tax=Formimonas warabiya TaxID=1761012 RepID=A0A3G1L152_FORW1|nr:glycoside hydrolase family 13 protein [Candidatus Formimonas warabiya]ATW28215.1 alpha-glycosidase [Candidatus Formimonas warabiya]